ncbi:MAG TPA: ABC transporter substrate-binding protein [Methylomusa anaerophila]|uniref:NMT1/THI5 like protein n=1 Tax=Methylomusa anaerophila TaxID=1930071 RepID=A0A348AIL2_9FIRM|nr:ABC transporter substrate-binding protein [Methylomusa anaerophila]BBB90910.1 NMT1/THI5 like protein [Methylomusa anaerophila]HML90684.1 ABC transporter substrate-binding protein [Methylomusa anaerophila]
MKNSSKYKMIISMALILAAILIIQGCSFREKGNNVQTVDEKQYNIIKVSTPAEVTVPSVYFVGEEMGFFAEEGIKLEYAGVVPSTQVIASVVAGKMDVGGIHHVSRTITGIAAGAKIKAVAAGNETTEKLPFLVYVTLKDSPIKTAQDLIGKKIGTRISGSINEYLLYSYMKQHNIADPKNKVEFLVMKEPEMEQALRQKDIDVAGFSKTPDFIAERGEFKVLFSDYDVWGSNGGGAPFYFSEQFIKEKPDVVKHFVAAVAKTNNWINENPEKAIEITAKRAGRDIKWIKKGHFAPNAIIKDETVQLWIDQLTEFGEIKKKVTSNEVYTNEFNPYFNR